MKKRFILPLLLSILLLCGCTTDSDVKEEDKDSDDEIVIMQVIFEANMTRDKGWGDCGISPWNKGCTTSRAWWGYELKNLFVKNLIMIPDGENRWVVTNNQHVLEDYAQDHDIDLTSFTSDVFTYGEGDVRLIGVPYKKAFIDFSTMQDCSGSVDTKVNYVQIMGEIVDGNIELVFSIDANETENGVCTNYPFSFNATNWRWAVSSVLTGDPNNLTITLTEADNMPAGEANDEGIIDYNGLYYKEFSGDTNPSPQKRDHVKGNITLFCSKYKNGELINTGKNITNCPWNEIVYK